jgi:allantoinase
LWAGLREGVIDMVVTDHSPCPPEMKRVDTGRFDLAWGGIVSLSIALPVMWTDANRRGFGLEDIARWMSSAPASLAGVGHKAGALEIGHEANFVVFDTEAESTVRSEKLHYRHAISPYMGETLRGMVKATYLRGEAIFQIETFAEAPAGREVTLS